MTSSCPDLGEGSSEVVASGSRASQEQPRRSSSQFDGVTVLALHPGEDGWKAGWVGRPDVIASNPQAGSGPEFVADEPMDLEQFGWPAGRGWSV